MSFVYERISTLKGTLSQKEDVKIRISEILKVNVFSRPLLERDCMHRSFLIENISFSRNCDTCTKTKNTKSVTDASIWVMFISKNSDTLEIENSLLNSPIIIPCYGFHFRSTDQGDKPHS